MLSPAQSGSHPIFAAILFPSSSASLPSFFSSPHSFALLVFGFSVILCQYPLLPTRIDFAPRSLALTISIKRHDEKALHV